MEDLLDLAEEQLNDLGYVTDRMEYWRVMTLLVVAALLGIIGYRVETHALWTYCMGLPLTLAAWFCFDQYTTLRAQIVGDKIAVNRTLEPLHELYQVSEKKYPNSSEGITMRLRMSRLPIRLE